MAVLASQVYFYAVLVIGKKRNLAPTVHENTPFWPPNLKKNFWRGGTVPFPDPYPCGEGDSPSSHLTPLGAFGASTRGRRWLAVRRNLLQCRAKNTEKNLPQGFKWGDAPVHKDTTKWRTINKLTATFKTTLRGCWFQSDRSPQSNNTTNRLMQCRLSSLITLPSAQRSFQLLVRHVCQRLQENNTINALIVLVTYDYMIIWRFGSSFWSVPLTFRFMVRSGCGCGRRWRHASFHVACVTMNRNVCLPWRTAAFISPQSWNQNLAQPPSLLGIL